MTETPAPPIPGHTITFALPSHLTTRAVNTLIRNTTDTVIARNVAKAAPYEMLRHATANYERRERQSYLRKVVPAHYVHGFGTPHRDTLVGRYTPTLREVVLHFPPNYHGAKHPSTDDWLRTRVDIWYALLFAIGGPKGVGGVTTDLT